MNIEYEATYTKHITRKNKIWSDGFLVIKSAVGFTKALLYNNDDGKKSDLLDSYQLPAHLNPLNLAGVTLTINNCYLVDIQHLINNSSAMKNNSRESEAITKQLNPHSTNIPTSTIRRGLSRGNSSAFKMPSTIPQSFSENNFASTSYRLPAFDSSSYEERAGFSSAQGNTLRNPIVDTTPANEITYTPTVRKGPNHVINPMYTMPPNNDSVGKSSFVSPPKGLLPQTNDVPVSTSTVITSNERKYDSLTEAFDVYKEYLDSAYSGEECTPHNNRSILNSSLKHCFYTSDSIDEKLFPPWIEMLLRKEISKSFHDMHSANRNIDEIVKRLECANEILPPYYHLSSPPSTVQEPSMTNTQTWLDRLLVENKSRSTLFQHEPMLMDIDFDEERDIIETSSASVNTNKRSPTETPSLSKELKKIKIEQPSVSAAQYSLQAHNTTFLLAKRNFIPSNALTRTPSQDIPNRQPFYVDPSMETPANPIQPLEKNIVKNSYSKYLDDTNEVKEFEKHPKHTALQEGMKITHNPPRPLAPIFQPPSTENERNDEYKFAYLSNLESIIKQGNINQEIPMQLASVFSDRRLKQQDVLAPITQNIFAYEKKDHYCLDYINSILHQIYSSIQEILLDSQEVLDHVRELGYSHIEAYLKEHDPARIPSRFKNQPKLHSLFIKKNQMKCSLGLSLVVGAQLLITNGKTTEKNGDENETPSYYPFQVLLDFSNAKGENATSGHWWKYLTRGDLLHLEVHRKKPPIMLRSLWKGLSPKNQILVIPVGEYSDSFVKSLHTQGRRKSMIQLLCTLGNYSSEFYMIEEYLNFAKGKFSTELLKPMLRQEREEDTSDDEIEESKVDYDSPNDAPDASKTDSEEEQENLFGSDDEGPQQYEGISVKEKNVKRKKVKNFDLAETKAILTSTSFSTVHCMINLLPEKLPNNEIGAVEQFLGQPLHVNLPFSLETLHKKTIADSTRSFNADQLDIIASCIQWFSDGEVPIKTTAPMLLVQGVFGSGKSYLLATIARMLANILQKANSNSKILILSGTNCAVDSIVQQIIKMELHQLAQTDTIREADENTSKFFEGIMNRINIARLGRLGEMSPDVLISSVSSSKMKDQVVDEYRSILQNNSGNAQLFSNINLQYGAKTLLDNNILPVGPTVWKKRGILATTISTCLTSNVLDSFFHNNKCPIVLIDEGSQIHETALVSCLLRTRCRKVLLVGDTRQLPAVTKGENVLQVSFMERIIMIAKKNALLYSNSCKILLMRTQYRCVPLIGSLCSRLFYENTLINGREVTNSFLNQKWKPLHAVLWRPNNKDDNVEKIKGRSRSNPAEAKVIKDIINDIYHCYSTAGIQSIPSIGVICLYRAQAEEIRHTLFSTPNGQAPYMKQNASNRNVTIATVDGFQGCEKDIIILSCVRKFPSRTSQHGGETFTSCPKRMNVALSRATQNLIIVGSHDFCTQHPIMQEVVSSSVATNIYLPPC